MELTVVSNIGQQSAFFNKLLEVHSNLKGSALNPNFKQQTWNMKLINTAVTIGKGGTKFPYFQAVDLGRSPVTTRFSGFIVFGGVNDQTGRGQRIFANEVRAAHGYQITAQATAKINTTFDADLHRVFNKWLEKHSEGELVQLEKVRPQQAYRANKRAIVGHQAEDAQGRAKVHRQDDIERATLREAGLSIIREGLSLDELEFENDAAAQFLRAAETPIISDTAEEEDVSAQRIERIKSARNRAYNEVFERLLNKSGITFNADDIIRQAEAAGAAAGSAEANRLAGLRSAIVNKGAFKNIASQKDNPAIQRLIKIPNWYALAGIFAKVTGDQVEGVFKPLTPSRQETGNFKLVYVGGKGQALLPPSTGGSLRNGYKLVTNIGLEKLIAETA